jgi:hypothetical protein
MRRSVPIENHRAVIQERDQLSYLRRGFNDVYTIADGIDRRARVQIGARAGRSPISIMALRSKSVIERLVEDIGRNAKLGTSVTASMLGEALWIGVIFCKL